MTHIKTKPPDRAPRIKTNAARTPKKLMRRSLLSARKQAHGPMKIGNALVPFVNRFPKNTELYRRMITKPRGMGVWGKKIVVVVDIRKFTAAIPLYLCYNCFNYIKVHLSLEEV